MQTLYIERETAYDSAWVLALVRSLTLFPPGSMVALHNGDLALLRTRQRKPQDMQVWAVQNRSGALLQPPQPRSTAQPDHAVEQPVAVPEVLYAAIDWASQWQPPEPPTQVEPQAEAA